MVETVEHVSTLVESIQTAQKQLAPALAKVVIEAVRNHEKSSDLLQLIGAISGQGLRAEDVLIAIRDELDKPAKN